jgi:hypothetical protein
MVTRRHRNIYRVTAEIIRYHLELIVTVCYRSLWFELDSHQRFLSVTSCRGLAVEE